MPAAGMVHAYAATRTLDRRRGEPGRWDEMVGFHGRVRRGWRDLSAAAEALGPEGLATVAVEANQLLAEDGVTYRPLGGEERLWGLDPLPLFLDEGEWASLEPGLVQRTELLDRLLADLYGPRETIRAGLLPGEIVYAHPGFVRAWDQVVPADARQIFLAAADLARDADGSWCVLGDRVQAPSGAGYAMANRRTVARVLPALHRQSEIHRLAPFFHAMRLGLEQLAPPTAEAPRIVQLTPGIASETAYEQAFLSALLGCPLVRGADLVVSDGRVWQRTLGRLEPVDVILRRVDAAFCDPLDLRADSELGVPGLIEAARTGSVRVVNGLGAGVLENPALLPFLPGLAHHLLGEPLRLKSVPTWWCGEPEGRAHVLAELDSLVLLPLAPGDGPAAVNGWECDPRTRSELRTLIAAQPSAWVGQQRLPCSTAPSIVGDGLHPRQVVLRIFAVASGAAYQVMTGGLANLSSAQAIATGLSPAPEVPLTKDIWIRNTRGAPTVEPWVREVTPSQMIPLTLSPRVIEDMFWLGRYAERAEDTARLLRAVSDRMSDFHSSPETSGAQALGVLLTVLTEVTGTWPGFGTGPDGTRRVAAAELTSLILDETRPGTLAFAVRRLTRVAGDLREQLSIDTWLVLGSLDRELARLRGSARAGHGPRGPDLDISAALARVMERLLALSGLTAESLVRDAGWRFSEIGRRIERAMHVSALLAQTMTIRRGPAIDSLVLESVLIAAESIITYRRRHQARAGVATVLDLLVIDRENPRSLAYCLDRIGESLDRLPAEAQRLASLRAGLGELRESIRDTDTSTLAGGGGDERGELRALLDSNLAGLRRLADDLDAAFFVHPVPQRQLAGSLPARR